MDFAFSDEQQMLRESTRRFIAERCGFEQRQRIRASDAGWSRDVWSQLAELGLLAIAIPEAHGGLDVGAVGTMLVANAVGEGLLLEPFWASAVLATRVLVELGDEAQRARWLPALAAGDIVAVLAHDEDGDGATATPRRTTAARSGDGWQLDGAKALVYHAPAADLLLVSANAEGATAVFVVPADATGLTLRAYRSVDDQCAADVALDGVIVPADARLSGDAAGLQRALDFALAVLCAEAFGAMDRVLAATIEYSRQRVQFGQPIGRLQALQHRMTEMLMHLEQARSLSYLAATGCTDPDADARAATLSAAKALMGQSARYIGQQAVQLHGGMGMTDELAVSHWFKRLLAFELRAGTTDAHLARYRQQLRAD